MTTKPQCMEMWLINDSVFGDLAFEDEDTACRNASSSPVIDGVFLDRKLYERVRDTLKQVLFEVDFIPRGDLYEGQFEDGMSKLLEDLELK